MSHNSQEHNRFLAACGVSRGASLSKKNEKMSQEVKKEPFAAFFIEGSLQAFQYFQKPSWFYLLTIKDILMGKSMRQNFFQCEMPEPLLQRSLLKKWGETRDVVVKPLPVCFATEQSKVKASLFVIKNVQDRYEICQNVP